MIFFRLFHKQFSSISHSTLRGLAMLTVLTAAAAVISGCSGQADAGTSGAVSAADMLVSSSEKPSAPLGPTDAVGVYVGENRIEDILVMSYDWDGGQYENENSLNQLMIVKYMSFDDDIPKAAEGAEVSLKFAKGARPQTLVLTQQGNTFKANTGIPYAIDEVALADNGGGEYGFTVKFEDFVMYYYTLEYTLENGNRAALAFALEKAE